MPKPSKPFSKKKNIPQGNLKISESGRSKSIERSAWLDAIKGFAILMMTVHHGAGSIPILHQISNFTQRAFGYISIAEVLIFISGIVSARAFVINPPTDKPNKVIRKHFLFRALQLYLVHIVSIAIILLVQVEEAFPLREAFGWFTSSLVLLFQPTYFDILPLYVCFLCLLAPILGPLRRGKWAPILGLSFFTWLVSFSANYTPGAVANTKFFLPFFNPFSWQFAFILGISFEVIIQRHVDILVFLNRYSKRILVLSALVIAGLIWMRFDYDYDLPIWPSIGERERLGPLRVLNLLAYYILFQVAGLKVKTMKPPAWLAWVGKKTLWVYVGSSVMCYVFKALNLLGRDYTDLTHTGTLVAYIGVIALALWASTLWTKITRAIAVRRSPDTGT